MILDFEDHSSLPRKRYDICIVGAGPAGITIAAELRESGLTILLVESGGLKETQKTHDLNAGSSIGHPADPSEGRHRALGGSSTRWGGRCALLDPIDFERRDWVTGLTWPISYDELAPYYDRAKIHCNFYGGWGRDEDALRPAQQELRRFSSDDIKPFVWRVAPSHPQASLKKWTQLRRSRAYDWGTSHYPQLATAEQIVVLLQATVVDMRPSANSSRVGSVVLASLNGRRETVDVGCLVLCASGIENARLLLSCPESLRRLMDGADNVGRYLTQHPRGSIGSIICSKAQASRLQRSFNVFQRPPRALVEYEVGFALTADAQVRNQLVNASASIIYEASDESSWGRLKRLLRSTKQSRAMSPRNLLPALGALSRLPIRNLVRRFVLGREIHHAQPSVHVDIDLEQRPLRESRIVLGDDRDSLGVRRVVVDWRISEIERRTARFFADALAVQLEKLDLGRLEKAQWLDDGQPMGLFGNYHFIGTTRMSASPSDGVVDRDARVFGVDNLYVAGASIFSTGGHANPTMTIVALACRLADHIRSRRDDFKLRQA